MCELPHIVFFELAEMQRYDVRDVCWMIEARRATSIRGRGHTAALMKRAGERNARLALALLQKSRLSCILLAPAGSRGYGLHKI
jgi:hypothetical protein